jgi:hypothetical protein
MSQGRGRPEKYTEEVCQSIMANASVRGESLKEYCRTNGHVYITLIVALKRHGLSPRAQVAKHNPTGVIENANAGGVVLMDEEDTEQAIAEAEGAE